MNNVSRVFSEVLSVDAWHDPLRSKGNSSAVHIEVSFHEGRIGGDDQHLPFTFKVGLKRALLTVLAEPPLQIDRRSVVRDVPTDVVERIRVLDLKKKAQSNSSFKGKLSPQSISAAMSGSLSSEHETSIEDKVRIVQQLPKIIATSRPKGSNQYCWELTTVYDQILNGQPWNPIDPRLSVHSLMDHQKIDPSIKVLLSYKREDLEITELVPKDLSLLEKMKVAINQKINEAAAIQQIKLTLANANLEFGQLDDRFSNIQIADVLSMDR